MHWVRLLDEEHIALPQDCTPRHHEIILAFGTLCVIAARRECAGYDRTVLAARWTTAGVRPGDVTPEELSALARWALRHHLVRCFLCAARHVY